jgi:DNA replication protein DnaC
LRWIAKHSGLEFEEQHSILDSFRVISAGDASHLPQRAAAKEAIQEAIRAQRGLYTFYGDFGSGKTLALQVVLNELRQAMVEGYYAPFAAIVDHLRNLFSARKDTSAYWQRLLDIPVLALDEVSRFDDGRAWIRDRLFVLADTRYRLKHSHLTLFATNANPKAALPPDDAIGYLFSRMREGQLCELRGDLRSEVRQW